MLRSPFNRSLTTLALAATIPVLLFSAWTMHLFMKEQRHAAETRIAGVAQAISVAADRELSRQMGVLERFAASTYLELDDLLDARKHATEFVELQGWLGISLQDPDWGKQLFNTSSPADASLPELLDPTAVRWVAKNSRSMVAGAVHGPSTNRWFVLLRAPVMRDGRAPMVLAAALAPEAFSSILMQQKLPPDWTVAILDANLRIVGRSRAAEQFVGKQATPSLAERIRGAERDLFLALNQEGDRVYTVFHRSSETGWAVAIGLPAELIDGPARRSLILTGLVGAIFAAIGVAFAVFVGRTIARQRRAEEALRTTQENVRGRERRVLLKAKEEAERESEQNTQALLNAERKVHKLQKLEAIGRLTGGVAHDFNNLLQVIIGSLEPVRDEAPEGSSIRRFAEMAQGAAQRGADLTRKLLAFSRRQPLSPSRIDASRVMAQSVELLRRTLGAEVELRFLGAAEPCFVDADAGQLESAVLNLALNARDAMPEGGTLTLQVERVERVEGEAARGSVGETKPFIRLTVSDTGVGISPEVMDRVFEPFFTTKGSGRGSGLGLSMVHGFIKQSGGHIKIYSEPGHGTTVELYLQPAPAGAGDDEKPAHDPLVRGDETILLVEDDPDLRHIIAVLLRSLGYVLIEACSGPTALEALRAHAIDLLLTDIVLPGGMSGVQLAEQAAHAQPRLMVLFMTGYSEELIVGGKETARRLLRKPFSRGELSRKVREVLDSVNGKRLPPQADETVARSA